MRQLKLIYWNSKFCGKKKLRRLIRVVWNHSKPFFWQRYGKSLFFSRLNPFKSCTAIVLLKWLFWVNLLLSSGSYEMAINIHSALIEYKFQSRCTSSLRIQSVIMLRGNRAYRACEPIFFFRITPFPFRTKKWKKYWFISRLQINNSSGFESHK